MFLATVIMSVGISTWFIVGEKGIKPNLGELITKVTPSISGNVSYRDSDLQLFNDANRMHEKDEIVLDSGFLSAKDDKGNVIDGTFVFTETNSNSKLAEFTVCDISELIVKANETSTLYADKFQALPSTVSITFIPSDISKYESVEYTANVSGTVSTAGGSIVPIYPVARIGTTVYGTVEKALNVANKSTVYVLPGANPTIRETCTIPSNTTLTLHINDDNGTYGSESGQTERNYSYRTKVMESESEMSDTYANLRSGATSKSSFNTFADATESIATANLKNQLTIGAGITLTVESGATLNIGAIVGNTGSGMTGHTSGYYTQITMEDDAKIISSGTIDCLGYIKEKSDNNGSQIALNTGGLYAPFVIYDYGAARGTIAVAMNKYHKIYPFNVFDMPNVQSKIVCKSSAMIYGYLDLFSGKVSLQAIKDMVGDTLGDTILSFMGIDGDTIPAQHNLVTLNVVGNQNSIINSSGQVEIKYNKDETLYNSITPGMYNTGSTVNIDCYGGGGLGALNLAIKVLNFNVEMSTENYFFPINWKYNINLHNGNYNINYPAKFLSGSTLTVNQGAILNTSEDIIFYPKSTQTASENTADNDNAFYDPVPNTSSSRGYQYPTRDKAKLVVNGKANINGGLGGYIETNQPGAVLSINTDTLSLTEWEGNGMIETMSEKDDSQKDGTLISVAYPYFNGTIQFGLKMLNKFELTGEGGYFLTADGKARVTNGGDTEYVTQNAKGNFDALGTVNDFDKYTYISIEDNDIAYWKVATNYSEHFIKFNGNVPADGNITFLPSDESYWVENGTNPIINAISSPNPTCDFYEFEGWYLDADCTMSALEKDVSSYEKAETKTTKVYAKWTPTTYSIKLVVPDESGNVNISDYGTFSLTELNTGGVVVPVQEKKGYTFVGWYINQEYSNKLENNSITKSNLLSFVDSNNDVYLYGYYEEGEMYSLTFVGSNGTTVISSKEIKEGQKYNNFESEVNTTANKLKVDPNFEKAYTTSAEKYFTGKWLIDGTETYFTANTTVDKDMILVPEMKDRLQVSITIKYKSETGDADYNAGYEILIAGEKVKSEDGITSDQSVTYYVKSGTNVTVKTTDKGGTPTEKFNESIEEKKTIEATATQTKKKCIAAGTLITLADGTQKAVENVTADDVLLVFNHFTGEYEPAHILFLERGEYGYYNVINLEFSDGTATKLIFEHALFDLTLNKYVYITEQNYSEFVGHEFALSAESGYNRVTLIKASLDEEYTAPYSITTVYHFNYFIDGLFSLPGAIDGLFNYFEYADNLQYDEEKMQADIEKYGLYTYEDFAEHFSYEIFEYCIPVKYLKVAVGKGMITYEELIELFNKYASDLIT